MKHILTFSGGKDSLALMCWAKDHLKEWEVVFCDTGWESDTTYQHIKDIEQWLGKKIIFLKSDKFEDMIALFVKKKRAASSKARFCTEEMKSKPMIDYILAQKQDCVIYQGVRADESVARAVLKPKDEYFKFYFEPYGYTKNGKPKFHSYQKKAITGACDKFSFDVVRPILSWTAGMVFEYIFSHGLKPNPLYYEGFSRVGCFPCIMCRHSEIKLIAEKHKDRIEEIRSFEKKTGKTFFTPNYIPARFCSKSVTSVKSGKVVMVPTIDDVVNYVLGNPDQTKMNLTQGGCISVYNICDK